MAVTKTGTQGIIADNFPADQLNTGKVLRAVTAILLTKDVFFANIFRARGVLAQAFRSEITFAAVLPAYAKLTANKLDIFRVRAHFFDG